MCFYSLRGEFLFSALGDGRMTSPLLTDGIEVAIRYIRAAFGSFPHVQTLNDE